MKHAWVACLLVAVALAGCSSEEPEQNDEPTQLTQTATETQTSQTSTQTKSTATGGPEPGNESAAPQENRPPALVFSSDVAQGAAPLAVTFTIDGSDADDDALEWTLTVDESTETGVELPANVTLTFESEGTFIAIATLTDGTNTTEANITITIEAEAVQVPGPVTFSGTSLGAPLLGCVFSTTGELYHYYDVALAGTWLFLVDGTPELGDVATEWWAGDSPAGDEGASGIIPAGADNVAVCSSLGDPLDYTLTLHHPDYQF